MSSHLSFLPRTVGLRDSIRIEPLTRPSICPWSQLCGQAGDCSSALLPRVPCSARAGWPLLGWGRAEAGRGGAGRGWRRETTRLSGPRVRGLAGGEHGADPGRRAPQGWRVSRPAAVGSAARSGRRPAALALDLLAGQVRAAPRRFVSTASSPHARRCRGGLARAQAEFRTSPDSIQPAWPRVAAGRERLPRVSPGALGLLRPSRRLQSKVVREGLGPHCGHLRLWPRQGVWSGQGLQ